MSINGIGLYYNSICTEAISEVNGKFVLNSIDVYDFGRTLQLWILNSGQINLKNLYIFLTHDSSLTNFGVRFASLARLDGITDKTQDKLYLQNQNIAVNGTEGFSIKWDVLYGITNLPNQLISLVVSNHQVNVSTFQ